MLSPKGHHHLFSFDGTWKGGEFKIRAMFIFSLESIKQKCDVSLRNLSGFYKCYYSKAFQFLLSIVQVCTCDKLNYSAKLHIYSKSRPIIFLPFSLLGTRITSFYRCFGRVCAHLLCQNKDFVVSQLSCVTF